MLVFFNCIELSNCCERAILYKVVYSSFFYFLLLFVFILTKPGHSFATSCISYLRQIVHVNSSSAKKNSENSSFIKSTSSFIRYFNENDVLFSPLLFYAHCASSYFGICFLFQSHALFLLCTKENTPLSL